MLDRAQFLSLLGDKSRSKAYGTVLHKIVTTFRAKTEFHAAVWIKKQISKSRLNIRQNVVSGMHSGVAVQYVQKFIMRVQISAYFD